MERKPCPAFDVDCVVNFWDLARYAEMGSKKLFYKLWPDNDFEEDADCGRYAIIDVYEKITSGDDETREMWDTIKFYIEDYGYRFYDKVMFIF